MPRGRASPRTPCRPGRRWQVLLEEPGPGCPSRGQVPDVRLRVLPHGRHRDGVEAQELGQGGTGAVEHPVQGDAGEVRVGGERPGAERSVSAGGGALGAVGVGLHHDPAGRRRQLRGEDRESLAGGSRSWSRVWECTRAMHTVGCSEVQTSSVAPRSGTQASASWPGIVGTAIATPSRTGTTAAIRVRGRDAANTARPVAARRASHTPCDRLARADSVHSAYRPSRGLCRCGEQPGTGSRHVEGDEHARQQGEREESDHHEGRCGQR